ncbi:GTP-binding protein [Candidatus Omnitrophota bacterium]
MEEQRLNLVITGHVDHGKSTLIGRLLFETGSLQEGLIKEIRANLKGTGIKMEFAHIMDYFEEERKEERTIDTTQFFFKTKKRHYAIIDTPGHKEFIKNMITGSSQAHAAVLIISAKEGIEEQTKRHAYVLNMLGIKHVILAVNKMDLVEFKQERFEEIKSKAQEIIELLNIKPENVVPISAQQGDNISRRSKQLNWYRGLCLIEVLNRIAIEDVLTKGFLRLPVQDRYTIDNKNIAVGRIACGTIKSGENIVVQPQNIKTNIKSIEVFKGGINSAGAGQSIGITLEEGINLHRGQVICDTKHNPHIDSTVKANIFWLASEELKLGDSLRIKCGTFEESCTIAEIAERIDSSSFEVIERNSSTLGETQVGKVVISIDSPMAFESFYDIEELGRFVLLKDNCVCAGGIIMEQ